MPGRPRVLLARMPELGDLLDRLAEGDRVLIGRLVRLESLAYALLEASPHALVHNDVAPPSGQARDFATLAAEVIPSDSRPVADQDADLDTDQVVDGAIDPALPDDRALRETVDRVRLLTMAWFLRGDEQFAQQATRLVEVFFLSPRTGMNPKAGLEFALMTPGAVTGRPQGIVQGLPLVGLLDALGILEASPSWTTAHHQAMNAWMADYLDWLLQAPIAGQAAVGGDVHATAFHLQLVAISMYLGRLDVARPALVVSTKLIDDQIQADGEMPIESQAPGCASRMTMNLRALAELSRLGEHLGHDLWGYQGPHGGTLRQAGALWLERFTGETPWPTEAGRLPEVNDDDVRTVLRLFAGAYHEPDYAQTLTASFSPGYPLSLTAFYYPVLSPPYAAAPDDRVPDVAAP